MWYYVVDIFSIIVMLVIKNFFLKMLKVYLGPYDINCIRSYLMSEL